MKHTQFTHLDHQSFSNLPIVNYLLFPYKISCVDLNHLVYSFFLGVFDPPQK